MSTRRDLLIAKIELQRAELAAAYHDLEKPVHYAEMGLRGFGFLKRYPWITVVAPSALSMIFSTLGFVLRKGQPPQRKLQEQERKDLHQLVDQVIEKRKKPIVRWLGYGFTAFRTYRKARTFLPFLP